MKDQRSTNNFRRIPLPKGVAPEAVTSTLTTEGALSIVALPPKPKVIFGLWSLNLYVILIESRKPFAKIVTDEASTKPLALIWLENE